MSASIDLNPKHHKIVSDILYEYSPDRDVLVFGSRAKWSAKDKSDLDLCIMGDEPLPKKTMVALTDALEESSLPIKVDVVEWAKIEDGFREIIKRDGVELGWPELSLAIVYPVRGSWTNRGVLLR
ncbi:MAG: nucleotidyltransferase domain-containing protein [Alphaproteobacteria bacterium]|nr:nucleotidyltransferase domain-containing protein [Alphaproteobacteria bacterium]